MKLFCFKDYNYGKRPAKPEPTMMQMMALMANPKMRAKVEAEEEDESEYLIAFKAGETYEIEAELARRLLRDHGPIDHMAWRLAQSKSDMPISNPPKRAEPTFMAVDAEYERDLEARRQAVEAAAELVLEHDLVPAV